MNESKDMNSEKNEDKKLKEEVEQRLLASLPKAAEVLDSGNYKAREIIANYKMNELIKKVEEAMQSMNNDSDESN